MENIEHESLDFALSAEVFLALLALALIALAAVFFYTAYVALIRPCKSPASAKAD